MDFRTAWSIARAEITPQPWTYTVDDTTLTVVSAGFRADKGEAEVIIRIGDDVEEWVRTPEIAALVAALQAGESWTSLGSGWGAEVTVDGLGVTVAVWQKGTATSIALPPGQRLPLASALARALDVARAWEN